MNEEKQIVVWDRFVRFFHWSLVLLIFLAYVTGESKGPLHKNIGLVLLGLVIARIFWGFMGTEHALFSNFVCSPVKALTYLKELATGKPTHYTGHNPAGAWMIILLLASSIIICVTGYAAHVTKGRNHSLGSNTAISFISTAYADQDDNGRHDGKHNGRGRHNNSDKGDSDGDGVWGDIHEASVQFLLFLICLHVVGVVVSSRAHKENLVKSMITGKKDVQIK
jgi:cytochrome b